jgi:uncharacterized membrane protein
LGEHIVQHGKKGKPMKESGAERTAHLAYFSVVAALGAAAVGLSLYRVVSGGVSYQWIILAYLTVLTGTFTIAIPGVNSKLSVSDAFVFINTILFGTAAGVLTAALDGAIGSFRCRTASQRKWTIPFNTAVLAISAFAAGEAFFGVFNKGPLSQAGSIGLAELVLPAVLSASVYFLCNSVAMAIMVALAKGDRMLQIWRTAYLKTFVLFGASALIGALCAFAMRSITPLTLLIVVSLLVATYFLEKVYVGPGDARIDQSPAHKRFHYFMVALGLGFIALLLQDTFGTRVHYQWMILAVLAVLGGFITVKIPGIKIKFSLADTFVFANIILFGPIIGAVTAAIDGLVGSLRCKSKSRRMEFTLFNLAATTIPAYIAGEIFVRILAQQPISQNLGMISAAAFFPVMVLAISYYLLNSTCVAIIVALQAERDLAQVWRENLLWGLIPPIACALAAVFIAAGIRAMTPLTAAAMLIMLAAIYLTFRASVEKVAQRA